MLKLLDLFSGIGGFSLAARWTGKIETVGFCENNAFCQKVLEKNFPGIPIHKDIRTLKNEGQYGAIDIISGGFPCQPFSVAGKQRGRDDNRYLWPEMFKVLKEFKPTWVLSENVPGIINLGLDQTISDLENEGYEVQTLVIPACAKDAQHQRNRVWILAYSNQLNDDKSRFRTSEVSQFKTSKISSLQFWQPEPELDRVVDGVPNRVERIKGLGNAIVPQVAFEILNNFT